MLFSPCVWIHLVIIHVLISLLQRWLRLGSEASSVNSLNTVIWPKGRDGHASCVLSEGAHPQILVTGGWDKQNQLLYDAWVLDVTSGSWTEVSVIHLPNIVAAV